MGAANEMVAKYVVVIIAITSIMFGHHNVVDAKDLIVGDDQGWMIPNSPTTYSDWASKHTFSVDDVLVFDFVTGAHTVALVTKEAFDTCDTGNVISVMRQSPVRVPLKKEGQLHFICTVGGGGHCSTGQKLAINVTAALSHHHKTISSHHHHHHKTLAPTAAPTPAPAPAPSSSPSLVPLTIVASLSLTFLFLVLGSIH